LDALVGIEDPIRTVKDSETKIQGSEQFFNGTSAQYRLYSATQIES